MMKHATESFRKSTAARRLATPLIAALLSLGLSLSLTGCGGDRAEPHPEAGAGITIEGDWITVSAGQVDDTALYPGTVIASDRSPIASRMMGYLREINVREGEMVEKDQVLLTIDQSDVTSQIQQAEAALAKARSGLTNARSNYERFKRLYEDNAVPKQQFEQMKTAYEVARGDYNAAQAGLEQARSQVGYAQIRAPFAGTIIQRMADPGQLATPGQPLLMLMGSGDREIQVEVDDQAFAALAEGDAIEVGYRRIDGSATSFTGQVLRLVDAADPITRTHSVRIAVPTDVPLSPGSYVTVNIVIDQKPALTVPVTALHDRAGMQGVFVLDADDRARFRLVRSGQRLGDDVVVLAGLKDGDRVVTRAQEHLANGVKMIRTDDKGGATS